MEVVQMQRKFVADVASLFNEGLLDSQFAELHHLQDESNPGFVAEMVSDYFNDSEKILNTLTGSLAEQIVDFKRVDSCAHQFKGSSSSIGAQRIRGACIALRSFCGEQNIEACRGCLLQIKQEYSVVKNKLQNLLLLEQQIVQAGGAVPKIQY